MQQTCLLTGRPFHISAQEIEFCRRFDVPPPVICQEERIRRLMAARNERSLYHRKCDSSGAKIISAYSPEVKFPVYKNTIWWGDTWEALEYGRDFDFGLSFFEQLAKLQQLVPREGTSIFNCENCDYNSHIRECKNCYMNSLCLNTEDAYYCYWVPNNTDIMDCMYTYDSSSCYECSEVRNCYNCVLLQESTNCHDCFFSYQLRGCKNCIFCSNLANKEHYAFNKPCTKEEFAALKKKYFDGSLRTWERTYAEFLKMRSESVHRAVHNINCENVVGDHLYDSRNCFQVYDGHDNEDVFNSVSVGLSKNISDGYSVGWPGCEMVYQSSVARNCTNVAFCMHIWFSSDLRYCDSCVSCHDCFGCIGLKHKQYCILNQQYTKEQYEKFVPKIVEHMQKSLLSPPFTRGETMEWGQFFPPILIPFAYNETAGQDQMPISKEEAVQKGYHWREEDPKEYQPATSVPPDTIAETPDTITSEIFACVETGKNYKIVPQELAFYRRMQLPIPRLHPDTRHKNRMTLRNPRQMWERKCAKCGKKMLSTYAPERTEAVYCEECYLTEML